MSIDTISKSAEAYKLMKRVIYKMVNECIDAKYGFKVHTVYIAEVETIKDTLKHFEIKM